MADVKNSTTSTTPNSTPAGIMQVSTKKRFSATEFVEIFQASTGYDEVAKKTESTVSNVKNREKNLRKLGIPLIVFEESKKKRGLDVVALTNLANQLAGKKS